MDTSALEERLKQAGPFRAETKVEGLTKQVESLTSQLEMLLGLLKTTNEKVTAHDGKLTTMEANQQKLVDYVTK